MQIFFLFRLEDHHQCFAEQHKATSGGHDAHSLLFDGVCPVCPPGIHGCPQKQVRPRYGQRELQR